MTDSAILRPASGPWLTRGPGIRTFNIVTRAIGGRVFLNGITEFSPGAEIPAHFHNCEESVTILEGAGTLELDGEPMELEPFESTWIAAGVRHRFVNRGQGVLTILWIYGSANATRTVVATGVEVGVGDSNDVYTLLGSWPR